MVKKGDDATIDTNESTHDFWTGVKEESFSVTPSLVQYDYMDLVSQMLFEIVGILVCRKGC